MVIGPRLVSLGVEIDMARGGLVGTGDGDWCTGGSFISEGKICLGIIWKGFGLACIFWGGGFWKF